MLFEQYEHRVTESQPDVRTAATDIRGATSGGVCRAVFWNLFFELKRQAGLGFEIYVDNDLEDDCRCPGPTRHINLELEGQLLCRGNNWPWMIIHLNLTEH